VVGDGLSGLPGASRQEGEAENGDLKAWNHTLYSSFRTRIPHGRFEAAAAYDALLAGS
jgi:hypothetical protein